MPATFFTIERQTRRVESVVSGIIAAWLATIPWFLTYFAVMCFYPNPDVLGASVPWLAMMQGTAGPVVIAIFGIVMGWTLIETSTGIIHAALERVNNGLKEAHKPPMTGKQRQILTIIVLVGSMVLSKVGIIDLIATVYNALSYAFLAIYVLPLITVGVYKIFKLRKAEKENRRSMQFPQHRSMQSDTPKEFFNTGKNLHPYIHPNKIHPKERRYLRVSLFF